MDSTISKIDLINLLKEVKEPEENEDENQRFEFYIDENEVKISI